MKRLALLLPFALVALSSCADRLPPVATAEEEDVSALISAASRAPLRRAHAIAEGVTEVSEGYRSMVWRSDWDDSTMFAMAADSTYIVSIKIPGTRRGVWRGKVLVDKRTKSASAEVIRSISSDVSISSVDPAYPSFVVRIPTIEALSQVRRLPFIDYVEPDVVRGDRASTMSGAGCGAPTSPGPNLIASEFGDIMSPSYVRANIPLAWRLSQGQNVILGLADAIISSTNSEFYATSAIAGSGFESGSSSGRFFQETTPPEGGVCPHAERMAMLMAGPANGQGSVGVAWRSNFRSGAALEQVNIQFGPSMSQIARGVRFAAYAPANAWDELPSANLPKVVAMAFGQLTGSDLLSDVIQDLHDNYDVFFVGAAGTDVPFDPPYVSGDYEIVFPASLPWVLAVTSARADGSPDPGTSNHPLARLSAQRDNVAGAASSLCMLCEFNFTKFSGSSGATAIISGVAALVRSRFSWMNSEQVRQQLILRSSPQLPFARPHVDALAAIGSFCGRMIDYPYDNLFVDFESTSDAPQQVRVSATNSCGAFQSPMEYTWHFATDEETTYQYTVGPSVAVVVYPPAAASNQYAESGGVFVSIADPALGQSITRHIRIYRRATQCVAAGECP